METLTKVFKANKRESNKLDYKFVDGKGCFFFSKEDADKGHYKTGNEVGLYFNELEIDGVKMYQQGERNCWD